MTQKERSTRQVVTRSMLALLSGGMVALMVCSPGLVAASSQSTTIYACYNRSTHTLDAIALGGIRCGSTDNLLTWNQQGPQGIAGIRGKKGAQGPAGVQGTTGATGPAGPAGIQGPKGETGPLGPMGYTGAMGPAGSQGLIGPQGPMGPTGAQGAKGDTGDPGMRWRGQWSAVVPYTHGDVVSFNGSSWIALFNNYSASPDVVPADWQVVAAHGNTGATGAQGPQGIQGPKGNPGGLTGLQYLSPQVKSLTDCATSCHVAVDCPTGTHVIGGGYSMDPATAKAVTVLGSFPEDNQTGTHYSRWTVSATVAGSDPESIMVYATCAPVASS